MRASPTGRPSLIGFVVFYGVLDAAGGCGAGGLFSIEAEAGCP
jgi:hypothetical protein